MNYFVKGSNAALPSSNRRALVVFTLLLASAIPFAGCRTQGSANLGERIGLESGVEFDGPDGRTFSVSIGGVRA